MDAIVTFLIITTIIGVIAYLVFGGGSTTPTKPTPTKPGLTKPGRAGGRTAAGPGTEREFTVVRWNRNQPRSGPPPGIPTPGDGPWKVHENPNAICLMTGVPARNCTCDQHRSTL
ncbi:MAG TPA: hypothetical protein VE465_02395 [Streptosporangiaceae bacterium]|nr:hypothetical protein [Streptosporangiaceae bacterium]